MIKFLNFFVINCILLFAYCLCYEVPSVKLNLLDKGFSLSIPDEPGLKQVFYIVKLNDECPTLMDIVFVPKPDWTTTQTSKDLKPQDKLNISLLVNHQGEAVKSYQYLVVGENDSGIKAAAPPTKHSSNCDDTMIEVKCDEAQTVVLGMTHLCQGQLLFEDNFANTQLNTKKWSYDIRHRLIGTESEEFVLFDNYRENIFIHDGYLNIRPTLTQEPMKQAKLDFGSRCTPVFNRKKECELMPQSPFLFVPPFNSSQIYTSNTFQFKYGRIEIRAKLPKGEWILPYIMLQNYGVHDEKQIHIAFARGNEELLTTNNLDLSGKVLYAGIVRDVENNNRDFKQKSSGEHYGNDFHIYTLNWKSNEITMEVDGVQYGTITDNLDEFNKFFFITFGVSVGGHHQFPDNLQQPNNKPWSNTSPRSIRDFWQYVNNNKMLWSGNETLQIDYVKVYAV
ncbi:gram-negative bacteria-binding protein 2 [Calliphora vicina]|uniref:gram-negative bacteria-binding protein 2 n=1 Tax=Calliphora vicina TaxID=7373 RepID=UPI00325BB838